MKFSLLAIPMALALIFAFQNCGSKFQPLEQSSLGGSLADLGTSDLQFSVMDGTSGALVGATQDIIVDAPYTISITGVTLPADAQVTWTAIALTGAVHVHPGATPATAELHCEAAGNIDLSVSVVSANHTYTSRKMNVKCVVGAPGVPGAPTPTPAPGTPSATLVTFRIPAGTGKGPWNSAATVVKVNVGQTLRIVNDDTTVHRMHTNGAPCGHQPSDSATGQAYDCVVSAPIAATTLGAYDHNIGTNARFYVQATDGKALYATSCQGCHGAIANSQRRNSTPTQIRAALMNVSVMKTIVLNDDQVAAISYSLSH